MSYNKLKPLGSGIRTKDFKCSYDAIPKKGKKMNDVAQDTISAQMEQANGLPNMDTTDAQLAIPESLKRKIDAIKADYDQDEPQPVEVGYIQTEEDLTGTPVVL